MTDSKVQEIFNMAVQICEDNGYKPVKLIPKCGYTTRQNVYGVCLERRYRNNKEVVYTQVKVNKKFAEKANEQQMLNTLLHECLHSACGADEHHGGKWAIAAKTLNDKCGYQLSAKADFKDENGKTISTKADKYIIQCKCCGNKWFYSRLSKSVKNPNLYRCGICNGELERIK